MKNRIHSILPLACLSAALLPISAHAAVSVVGANSTTALAYAGLTSSTDLINSGQATLAGASYSPVGAAIFPGTGSHDGNYSQTFADNTYFPDTII